MLTRAFNVICFCIWTSFAIAQLPHCNLYHFTITTSSTDIRLSNPKFLTAFNENGYNNQPHFYGDDVVYFTTDYYGDNQTEIAKFDFFEEVLTRITYTAESEYSPTRIPKSEEFSCVRVELDGTTQSLSVYPSDGIGYAKRYMNNTSNIGYHCWIDTETVGLFLVEEPYHNLAVADAKSERRKIILDKIGRTLKVTKDNKMMFVHKLNDDNWYIKAYDKAVNKSAVITKTINQKEDFELMNDGSLLMGAGSVLYRFVPGVSRTWEAIMDLSEFGINNISRLVVRKNRLIIVELDT